LEVLELHYPNGSGGRGLRAGRGGGLLSEEKISPLPQIGKKVYFLWKVHLVDLPPPNREEP